ncbi:MAG: CBS domain-containing protein, partial [Candidatus Bathyarchaeota archaeon]
MAPETASNPIISVKEIMKTPAVTVQKSDGASKVAKLMAKNDVGSIIVLDKKGNPVGIVTERDLVIRVLAKSKSDAKVIDIMSTPLATVFPETGIEQAAKMMSKLEIRRLAVMEKGKLIGVISSKDIVSVTPALIEVVSERAKISAGAPRR